MLSNSFLLRATWELGFSSEGHHNSSTCVTTNCQMKNCTFPCVSDCDRGLCLAHSNVNVGTLYFCLPCACLCLSFLQSSFTVAILCTVSPVTAQHFFGKFKCCMRRHDRPTWAASTSGKLQLYFFWKPYCTSQLSFFILEPFKDDLSLKFKTKILKSEFFWFNH